MRLADGLPELAGTLANDMRKIVDAKSLLFPATYGASVTRIYPPKWAARAIPHAGGCDYYGLADQHRLQWIKACKGIRALPPKGFARSVDEADADLITTSSNVNGLSCFPCDFVNGAYGLASSSNSAIANMIQCRDVAWKDTCLVCRGKGHVAKQQKEDGSMLKCATLELGTKPQELIPSNYKGKGKANVVEEETTFSAKNDSATVYEAQQRHIEELQQRINEKDSVLKATMRKIKKYKKSVGSRPSSRASVSSADSSSLLSSTDDDDADSVESEGVPGFADLVVALER